MDYSQIFATAAPSKKAEKRDPETELPEFSKAKIKLLDDLKDQEFVKKYIKECKAGYKPETEKPVVIARRALAKMKDRITLKGKILGEMETRGFTVTAYELGDGVYREIICTPINLSRRWKQ